jgi:hypothetical protein
MTVDALMAQMAPMVLVVLVVLMVFVLSVGSGQNDFCPEVFMD